MSSLRLLVADFLSRGSSIPSRQAALKLIPGNVSYILSLTDLERQHDTDVRSELTRATLADPANYRLYIYLGLEYERVGDYNSASACLNHAARLSREFLAPWTLTNFYFRRGDTPEFLLWARKALEAGPTEPVAVFQLLWHSGAAPGAIDAAIPRTASILIPYLSWLRSNNHLAEAQPVATTVLANFGEQGCQQLLDYCSALAAGGESERLEAVDLWNDLCVRGLLHETTIFPAQRPDVVDPNFREIDKRLAFGWQAGINQVELSAVSGGLEVDFDGDQPEQCGLLAELVSLEPSRSYVLECGYDTDLPADNGVSFRIENVNTNQPIENAEAFLSADAHVLRVPFIAPANCRFARVALRYARQPGTVRATGSLMVKSVILKGAL